DVDQVWLLPPSIQDLVPSGHVAHFVRDTVRNALDLSRIVETYDEERGYPPYHPGMMVALLLYAYSQGVYSSRRIAKGCEERLDFAAVTGLQRPDFRTVSDFRKRHLSALSELFQQVLKLCQAAGLVKLGHVALDGTKIKANASKHKAMSYGRMKQAEPKLAAEVHRWLAQAAQIDKVEDRQHGAERRGDEMPDWVANKQARLEKIRAAKAALEAEAGAAAKTDRSDDGGAPPAVPNDKAQRNFTDPESRIMKTKDGFIQGYNAQAAVDGAAQVIVAHHLTNASNDQAQLRPLLDAIKANTGRNPDEASADAGYCSAANLLTLSRRRIAGYIATGRQRHGTRAAVNPRRLKPGLVARMATKLKRAGHRSRYRWRKQVVEPVFGQIKHARGFRQFLLRGTEKVRAEWAMICTVHNLLKLAKAP
ncbi:MAG TPA: IS1182 family transposase, partial [Steroidobacteraceae bacterium]|nr:IS1182 family transposase [Steroidobacteraceae bacterium]